MSQSRILSIHFPTAPDPESLPELAGLLFRLSPRLGVRAPDMIYIDIATTAHLFGGEAGVLRKLGELLLEKHVFARAAVADDLPTAGALSRSDLTRPMIVASGQSEAALAPLPIKLLSFLVNPLATPTEFETRAAAEALEFLSMLGLRTLGDLARIPAATIGPRFGKLGALLHRRARGAADVPLASFHPTIAYREHFAFDPPVAILEPVLFTAKTLLARLETRLKHDLASALELTVFLETENCEEIELRVPLLRPLRNEKALVSIVRERLSRVELKSPLIALTIELSLPVADRGAQLHLFNSAVEQSEKLSELLGRLVAGLGPTLVSAAELRERYRPEASWEAVVFDPLAGGEEKSETSTAVAAFVPPRPTVLLPTPELLRAEIQGGKLVLRSTKKTYAVLSMEGPERLRGEWWDDRPHARDYFRAEAGSGEQLWIFRPIESAKDYYLHGYFD